MRGPAAGAGNFISVTGHAGLSACRRIRSSARLSKRGTPSYIVRGLFRRKILGRISTSAQGRPTLDGLRPMEEAPVLQPIPQTLCCRLTWSVVRQPDDPGGHCAIILGPKSFGARGDQERGFNRAS
jgi:hypothetical protein